MMEGAETLCTPVLGNLTLRKLMSEKMITEKTWDDFHSAGLLWLVNSFLHVFGWAIVFETEEQEGVDVITSVYTKFRGFSKDTNNLGFKKVTEYMAMNSEELLKEI